MHNTNIPIKHQHTKHVQMKVAKYNYHDDLQGSSKEAKSKTITIIQMKFESKPNQLKCISHLGRMHSQLDAIQFINEGIHNEI